MVLAACGGSDPVPIEGGESGGGGASSACPEGSFSTAGSSSSCTPWSVCPAGEDAPGTARSDRVCHVDDWRVDFEGDYIGMDIAAHVNGDIVVVGHFGASRGGASTQDAFIRRYDAFGRELWTERFGTGWWDDATAVSTALDGSSYVVGYTPGDVELDPLSRDGYIRKFDALGNTIWSRQFGSAADDEPLSVSTDPAGNVFVAAYAFVDGSQGSVRKYDSAGNELWTREVGSSGRSHVNAVAADSHGNVYVAAAEFTTDVFVEDLYLHKLDGDGKELWVAHYDGGDDDAAMDVAVDSEDNAIVFGRTRLPPPEPWNRRGLLRKYGSDGALLWSALLGDFVIGAGYYDYSVAVDKQDNVIIGSDAHYGDSMSALIAKFGADGTEQWALNLGSNGGVTTGVCTDERGDVLAVGSDHIQFVVRVTPQ
jgi:hypothetical protein